MFKTLIIKTLAKSSTCNIGSPNADGEGSQALVAMLDLDFIDVLKARDVLSDQEEIFIVGNIAAECSMVDHLSQRSTMPSLFQGQIHLGPTDNHFSAAFATALSTFVLAVLKHGKVEESLSANQAKVEEKANVKARRSLEMSWTTILRRNGGTHLKKNSSRQPQVRLQQHPIEQFGFTTQRLAEHLISVLKRQNT